MTGLFTYLTTDPQVLGTLAWAATAITVLGFAVTIWQLLRTKRSAEAAREAALGLVQRVHSRELLAKLQDAHHYLRAARDHSESDDRGITRLCLELSGAALSDAEMLSSQVSGDWTNLAKLRIRLHDVGHLLLRMQDPLQDDAGFSQLQRGLYDASQLLERDVAQARYAYDLSGE
jgi:hypothetical protein